MPLSGFSTRPLLCLALLAGLGAGSGPLGAQEAQGSPAQPAKHRHMWKLKEFTWVQLVPKEAGAAANDHPVQVGTEFLVGQLGAISIPAKDGDPVPLFSKDELALLRNSLHEAFAVADPDEDLLLLTTSRRGGLIFNTAYGVTARMFWKDNALQIIVHDARFDFMDAASEYGGQVAPTFTFGSRTQAGTAHLFCRGAVSRRADWLAFPLAAAPAAPQPAGVEAQPAAPAKDPAFFAAQEQRLRALKHMRDENLITEDEYQRKRLDVMNGL